MRLLFVFGTRPEAIKLAPVVRELAARPEFDCRICATGQHREMLAQFLELFELRPIGTSMSCVPIRTSPI